MKLEDSEDGVCNEIIKNEETMDVLESKDTQDYKVNGNKAVQIQPQKVKLKLVKGWFLLDFFIFYCILVIVNRKEWDHLSMSIRKFWK